jgi:Pretoxin HINT domain
MKIIASFSIVILSFTLSINTFAQNPTIKNLNPKLGETPDISVNAANNFKQFKKDWGVVDSIVTFYKTYDIAVKHLTKRQIAIYNDEDNANKEDYLAVGEIGCSWYCGGGPDSIIASSELKPNGKLDYKPDNCHDFSLRTAWVEGASGNGIGQSLTYRFQKLSPPVTEVLIYNGYMKSKQAWKDNARVKQLKLYINNKPYAIFNLKDTTALQIFSIGSHQGKKGDLYLKFEIVDVYKGDKYEDVAISEIEFDGTGVHCFAKGTLVDIPNGTLAIEQIKIGDTINSYNEQTGKTEPAVVLELAQQQHHNLYTLDFEGTILKVTDDHPFYFEGQYYSLAENNKYGLLTKALKLGQNILYAYKGQLKTTQLTSIKKFSNCETTYTITKLNRNKLFFVNGLVVAIEDVNMDNQLNQ